MMRKLPRVLGYGYIWENISSPRHTCGDGGSLDKNGKLGFSAARFSVPGFPFMIFHSILFLLHLFPLHVFPFQVKMFSNQA